MEEKDGQPVEQVEEVKEENLQPSREQILAISREENKNGDEMKKDIYKTAARLSFRVGIIIAVIVSALCLIFKTSEELMLPLYSVIFGMVSAHYLYVGKKENKKTVFGLAVAMAVCAVLLLAVWVLMLFGIVI